MHIVESSRYIPIDVFCVVIETIWSDLKKLNPLTLKHRQSFFLPLALWGHLDAKSHGLYLV